MSGVGEGLMSACAGSSFSRAIDAGDAPSAAELNSAITGLFDEFVASI